MVANNRDNATSTIMYGINSIVNMNIAEESLWPVAKLTPNMFVIKRIIVNDIESSTIFKNTFLLSKLILNIHSLYCLGLL